VLHLHGVLGRTRHARTSRVRSFHHLDTLKRFSSPPFRVCGVLVLVRILHGALGPFLMSVNARFRDFFWFCLLIESSSALVQGERHC